MPRQAMATAVTPAVAPSGQRGRGCASRIRARSSLGFQWLLMRRPLRALGKRSVNRGNRRRRHRRDSSPQRACHQRLLSFSA